MDLKPKCIICGETSKYITKQLCTKCYQKQYREKKFGSDKHKYIAGGKICLSCLAKEYARWLYFREIHHDPKKKAIATSRIKEVEDQQVRNGGTVEALLAEADKYRHIFFSEQNFNGEEGE